MSRWIHSTKDPDWAALFTSYQKSAYRLEGQQIYDSESEREHVCRFVAGEPPIIDFDWMVPKIRAQVEAGRTHTTVRVVMEPPTDYTRWELSRLGFVQVEDRTSAPLGNAAQQCALSDRARTVQDHDRIHSHSIQHDLLETAFDVVHQHGRDDSNVRGTSSGRSEARCAHDRRPWTTPTGTCSVPAGPSDALIA